MRSGKRSKIIPGGKGFITTRGLLKLFPLTAGTISAVNTAPFSLINPGLNVMLFDA